MEVKHSLSLHWFYSEVLLQDVWNMVWSEDSPDLFAMMEKGRMYIFRSAHCEHMAHARAYCACPACPPCPWHLALLLGAEETVMTGHFEAGPCI